jgi:hypothetical protein
MLQITPLLQHNLWCYKGRRVAIGSKSSSDCRVAIGTERHDEGRFDLVILVESDLVITRVAIKKGQHLAAGC